MTAPVDALAVIDALRDLARHRLTMKRREFDRMVAAGKEPNPLVVIKAERAEYLVQQGEAARAAVGALAAAAAAALDETEGTAAHAPLRAALANFRSTP